MPVVGPPISSPQLGSVRQYRVRGVDLTNPADPITSAWSAVASPSPGPTTLFHCFLSDPTDQTSGAQFDMLTDWKPLIHEEDTIYYALGRPFAIKSTAGTKGISGTVEATTLTYPAWLRIRALLESTAVLLLQLPAEQFYIMLDGDRTGDVLLSTMARTDFNQIKHQFIYKAAAMP
jgi:hypothetical protein